MQGESPCLPAGMAGSPEKKGGDETPPLHSFYDLALFHLNLDGLGLGLFLLTQGNLKHAVLI